MGRVLHASYSGYFPFCISKDETIAVGPGTFYPIAMRLKDIMLAFWRVKTWKITDNGSLSNFNFQPETESGDFLLEEKDIVCNRGLYRTKIARESYPEESQTIRGLNWLLCFASPEVIFRNNQYWPYLNFNMTHIRDSDDGNFEFLHGQSSKNFTYTEKGDFVTILGYRIQLYVRSTKLAPNVENVNYSASLSPSVYWSYGGTWNTATGQPL